jgi:hypothetical protein
METQLVTRNLLLLLFFASAPGAVTWQTKPVRNTFDPDFVE